MITVDTIGQYQTLYVHVTDLRKGAKPGATRIVSIRRNGATKTWKTRPTEFRAPFKYGLRDCLYVTHENAHRFHPTEEAAAQSPAGRWINC